MAAGLGFKTFTTGEVLTAADVNGYLMQGVLVFASEAARNSAITSPQEGQFAYTKDNNSLWYYTGSAWVASGATGDIEGVTAGTGISGGGTSGTVTITNSMATAIDAKGDLIVGTGADAFSRLAVGTNGQVLTADSSEATGLKFATPAAGGAGLTLVSKTTIGTTVSSVTVSSAFSATYENYRIIVTGTSHSTDSTLKLTLGSTTTGYYVIGFYQAFGTTTLNGFAPTNIAYMQGNYGGANGSFGSMEIFKPQLAQRTGFTTITASPTTTGYSAFYNGFLNDATQYTAFTLTPDSGTITGGEIRVYGYQNS